MVDKVRAQVYLENAAMVFLCLFLLGNYTHNIFVAVGNIAFFGAALSLLGLLAINREYVKNNFISNLKASKWLIIAAILMLVAVFAISAFPYDTTHNYVALAFKDLKRGMFFILLSLCLFNGSKKMSMGIFLALCTAFFADTVHTIVKFLIASRDVPFGELYNVKDAGGGVIERDYAFSVELLFWYVLTAFLIAKNGATKFGIVTFLIIVAAMDILTRARGSILACFVTGMVFLWLVYKNNSNLIKAIKYKKTILVAISVVVLAASHVPHVKQYLTSGFYMNSVDRISAGRVTILAERLPLLFASDRAYTGIGFGDDQYSYFLNSENVTKKDLGVHREPGDDEKWINGPWWAHDEPTLVAVYYHYGVVGTLIFAFMIFYLLFASYKRAKDNVLYLGLFGSVLAFYGIRGIFSNHGITFIFIMIGIFILFNYKKESAN